MKKKSASAPGATEALARVLSSAGAKPQAKAGQSEIDLAISTDLAPAAAIAVLDKASEGPGGDPPALEVLGAAVTQAADKDKVRVQLMFENGAVLPLEMSIAAGRALEQGLSEGHEKGPEGVVTSA